MQEQRIDPESPGGLDRLGRGGVAVGTGGGACDLSLLHLLRVGGRAHRVGALGHAGGGDGNKRRRRVVASAASTSRRMGRELF